MGRPKGYRLTPEQRKRCRPTNLRGGRKPGAQPDRKGPIPKEHALTPDERNARYEQIKAGLSIVTAHSLRTPYFKIQRPDGRTEREQLMDPARIPRRPD
jgi:hypothetical protein